MRKTLLGAALAAVCASVPALAHATCANGGSIPMSLTMGGPSKHVTVVDKTTCAVVGPLSPNVSGTPSSVYLLTKDATGFLVAPVAIGFDNIIFSSPGYTNAVPVAVTVSPAAALDVTQP